MVLRFKLVSIVSQRLSFASLIRATKTAFLPKFTSGPLSIVSTFAIALRSAANSLTLFRSFAKSGVFLFVSVPSPARFAGGLVIHRPQ